MPVDTAVPWPKPETREPEPSPRPTTQAEGPRRAAMSISLHALSEMLNLPQGVRLLRVREDDLMDGVQLLLESDAFEPCQRGYMPNFVDAVFTKSYDKEGKPLPIQWQWRLPAPKETP